MVVFQGEILGNGGFEWDNPLKKWRVKNREIMNDGNFSWNIIYKWRFSWGNHL